MKADVTFRQEFVTQLPDVLQDRTLYVSMEFATVAHKCACGCGNDVITPLGRNEWHLTYDGESISLYPSIGNWSFPCKSHYFIKHSAVSWARTWSQQEIENGRAYDRHRKEQGTPRVPTGTRPNDRPPNKGFWRKFKKRFS